MTPKCDLHLLRVKIGNLASEELAARRKDLHAFDLKVRQREADAGSGTTYGIRRRRESPRHVKVALSRDGGDELFSGYTHYHEAWRQWRLMQALPRPLRTGLRRCAVHFAAAGWRRFRNRENASGMPGWKRLGTKLEKRTRGWEYATPQQLLLARSARYTNPQDLVIQSAGAETNIADAQHWVTGADARAMMRHLDSIGYLPGDILVKVDRASMFVGLEVRAPLLDFRVTEFAWSLPEAFLADRRGVKRILRELMD